MGCTARVALLHVLVRPQAVVRVCNNRFPCPLYLQPPPQPKTNILYNQNLERATQGWKEIGKHKARDLKRSQSSSFSENVNKGNMFCLEKYKVLALKNAG